MFRFWDLLERMGFVFLVFCLIVLGFWQGSRVHSFTFDLFFVVFDVFWIEAVFSSVVFALFFLFSSVLFFGRVLKWRPSEESFDREVMCVVPCYRDSEVLHRSVDSLLDSEHENLEVLIVCEEDDEQGIREAERFAERDKVNLLVNDRYPGSKACAMNYAVEETDSEFIGFFDADQFVRSDFVGEAVAELRNYDVVTGRNVPRPEGLIESLSYYESVFFTYVSRQILTVFSSFRLVGSRSVVMKREVLEELDGYKEDVLTEDYDFTHRCYINGFDVCNIPLPVENLAAHSLKDWWGQRKRWMTGYFQVFSKLSKGLFTDFKGYRHVLSVLICGGSLLGSFLMLTIVSKFIILLLLGAEVIYLVPVFTLVLSALLFRLHDWKYNFVEKIGFSWLLVPLIFPFFSLITVRSFAEFVFGSDLDWFRVEK